MEQRLIAYKKKLKARFDLHEMIVDLLLTSSVQYQQGALSIIKVWREHTKEDIADLIQLIDYVRLGDD